MLCRLHSIFFAVVLVGVPGHAASIADPDTPRFAEGLRVLGMRDDVEVIWLKEYAHLDPEPLYLARDGHREAVFRAGEDLCMDKMGAFVACNRLEKRAVEQIEAVPGRDFSQIGGILPSPRAPISAPSGSRPQFFPTFSVPSGGGSIWPGPDEPSVPEITPPPSEGIPSVPLPASIWFSMTGLFGTWKVSRMVSFIGRWRARDRSARYVT